MPSIEAPNIGERRADLLLTNFRDHFAPSMLHLFLNTRIGSIRFRAHTDPVIGQNFLVALVDGDEETAGKMQAFAADLQTPTHPILDYLHRNHYDESEPPFPVADFLRYTDIAGFDEQTVRALRRETINSIFAMAMTDNLHYSWRSQAPLIEKQLSEMGLRHFPFFPCYPERSLHDSRMNFSEGAVSSNAWFVRNDFDPDIYGLSWQICIHLILCCFHPNYRFTNPGTGVTTNGSLFREYGIVPPVAQPIAVSTVEAGTSGSYNPVDSWVLGVLRGTTPDSYGLRKTPLALSGIVPFLSIVVNARNIENIPRTMREMLAVALEEIFQSTWSGTISRWLPRDIGFYLDERMAKILLEKIGFAGIIPENERTKPPLPKEGDKIFVENLLKDIFNHDPQIPDFMPRAISLIEKAGRMLGSNDDYVLLTGALEKRGVTGLFID